VNSIDAQARAAGLSDEEAAAICSRIDTPPPGGDVIGALVFVFILLPVTDELGFTKVYSFTRPIN
jgi:hypothetical protein